MVKEKKSIQGVREREKGFKSKKGGSLKESTEKREEGMKSRLDEWEMGGSSGHSAGQGG